LSTALGIVKGHQGFINVYSEFGHGAQFRIYLPAATPEEKKTGEGQEANLPRGQGELILVVDDEEAILQITQRTLEAYGYRVLTAADGTEAIALFAQHAAEVKAVVTDMMMPFMDGPSTIRALQKLDPLVKLIATSGFPDNDRRAESAGVPVKMFLAKPYTADRLLRALADLIQSD
jgi:CheY-like chemotaxis protein